jgi:hypothetical protein
MNREEVIEQMVEKYREELEGKDNKELMSVMSKDAIADLREEVIESHIEHYREKLEEQSDGYLGIEEELELVRDETINKMVEQYQEKLKEKDDEELAAEAA